MADGAVLEAPVSAPPTRGDPLRDALLDSRQRWRDLVSLATDIAFETDAAGRFVFVAPAETLGWAADALLGQPASLLLADAGGGPGFDPFRVACPVRARRAWLKRRDGGLACLAFAAAPLLDGMGGIVGARGVGQDVTQQDGGDAAVAAALRRAEVMDHILWRMRQEVLAPRMMQVTLEALGGATGAEGAAVIDMLGDGVSPTLLHSTGRQVPAVLHPALLLLEQGGPEGGHALAPDGRPLLVCPCQTRFGEQAGLVLWRPPDSRPWDDDDRAVVASTSILVRVILEHEFDPARNGAPGAHRSADRIAEPPRLSRRGLAAHRPAGSRRHSGHADVHRPGQFQAPERRPRP